MTGASHWMTIKLGIPSLWLRANKTAKKRFGSEVDDDATGCKESEDGEVADRGVAPHDLFGNNSQARRYFRAVRERCARARQIGDVEREKKNGVVDLETPLPPDKEM